MRRYTNTPLGEEVRAVAGQDTIEKEKRLSYEGREVLVATGHMAVDTSCCGAFGCGFAVIPGYLVRWKAHEDEQGLPVSEVEPIRDEEARRALRKQIMETERVQQVNFW